MITRDEIRAALIASISTALSQEICLNAPAAERLSNAALRAVADRLRKLGLRIVPVEATEGMVDAARGVYSGLLTESTARRLLNAAIAASPDPLAEVE